MIVWPSLDVGFRAPLGLIPTLLPTIGHPSPSCLQEDAHAFACNCFITTLEVPRKSKSALARRTGRLSLAVFACHLVQVSAHLFWSTTFAIPWLKRPGKVLENSGRRPA